jgi:hypothetical protein
VSWRGEGPENFLGPAYNVLDEIATVISLSFILILNGLHRHGEGSDWSPG